MASPFHVSTLVATPSYPNSVAWSEENLVAVASGHLVTILSPDPTVHARGLITLPPNKPFPVGAVKQEDLDAACLMPTRLSRCNRPCTRSISWSPIGFAPNSGCLLAVCTTEGHVKIYRPPFCECRSEWVEVVDISDMLFNYLDNINFGNLNVMAQGIAIMLQNSTTSKVPKNRKRKCPAEEGELSENRKGNDFLPHITAEQYRSRIALLSSLIVAWSPVLQSCANNHSLNCFYSNCCILAVGGKSGDISFWRIYEPPCYTIEYGRASIDPLLVGYLHAHNSWITAISWGISAASSRSSQLILVTASHDGSVMIWMGDVDGLITSSEPSKACFSLLKEVITTTLVSVSTISLVVPAKDPEKVVLAIGKGSGSFEVWTCDVACAKFLHAGNYDAHNQVVSGLAWAYDGSCLYSCSQDNAIYSWIFRGDSLSEVPFPCPGVKNSKNVQITDLCLGLAVSPGNLMIALVRCYDRNLLDRMYQARTQKATVEYYWVGGQSLSIPPEKHPDCYSETTSSSSDDNLMCWEPNILWSLKCYEKADKPLVIWDVMAALQSFRKSAPNFVENILFKWISKCFPGLETADSIEKFLSFMESKLSKISSRGLHLLNIMCRRLMLIDPKADASSGVQDKAKELDNDTESVFWNKLVVLIEQELRERLVAFTFGTFLSHKFCSASVSSTGTNWLPVGVAQMEQWVGINSSLVHSQLKLQGSKIKELKNSDCPSKESCSFCSAPVPFESPEYASCEGNKSSNGSNKSHRLVRCVVSMQLCSITSQVWHCICCRRSAGELLPLSFFCMSSSPLDEDEAGELSATVQGPLKPLCPFCGILLQRLVPDFLLSASPV